MKPLAFALLFVQQCLADSFADRADREFDNFKKKFNVQYTPSEEEYRRQVFHDNFKWIEEQNARGDLTYVLGVTRFTDQTDEEFANSRTAAGLRGSVEDLSGYLRSFGVPLVRSSVHSVDKPPPASKNWVNEGVVGIIKDQGLCGSCASFATTGTLESHYALAMHQTNSSIVPLSEQQLLDCDPTAACDGGLPSGTFTYIKGNGLTSETVYPYEARNSATFSQPCKRDLLTTNNLVVQPGVVTGYTQINTGDYDTLLSAVGLLGPVATMIDGTTPAFRNYQSGVITGPCGTSTLHIVVIVGYGETADGIKYWLIKNSWGTGWGDKGYAKVERGTGGVGMCGINTLSWYPHVNVSSAVTTAAPTANPPTNNPPTVGPRSAAAVGSFTSQFSWGLLALAATIIISIRP
ncbi:hypothetical protein FOZ63_000488 [Perkinsus olseni]|uniref:Uncharacterized protein n=1 Tax=Perkinsus olseni TaxID=32597 RepID=A0A7J6QD34_PEROL|nr:hypothetical protein FOZ63_000488 [Perkinsus olseni]